MRADDHHRVREWRAAIGRPEVSAGLEAIYASVGEAVAARGPACWASGRCCNFERSGHLLYATGLETAYTLARAAMPRAHPLHVGPGAAIAGGSGDEGAEAGKGKGEGGRGEGGGCPFQARNLCGVHGVRPLGCRVYFCDRSAQDWQRDLYERAMADLRALHDRCGISYLYGEWRSMLRLFAAAPP
jgi:Fe-S-cluster containining protein